MDGVYGTDETGVSIEDYAKVGPNNEVYLAAGQAIAFEVSASSALTGLKIGVKSVDGNEVRYAMQVGTSDSVMDSKSGTLNSATAQNVRLFSTKSITADTVYVMVSNPGESGVLSVTDLKATYSAGSTEATRSVTYQVNAAVEQFVQTARDNVFDCSIHKAFVAAETCSVLSRQTLTVVTSQDVRRIEIWDHLGNVLDVSATYTDDENGERVWSAVILMMLIGNCSYHVTAYGPNGAAGTPANVTITVLTRQGIDSDSVWRKTH